MRCRYVIYSGILWSSSLIILAKIWHGIGISKEIFDTLKDSKIQSEQLDNDDKNSDSIKHINITNQLSNIENNNINII